MTSIGSDVAICWHLARATSNRMVKRSRKSTLRYCGSDAAVRRVTAVNVRVA